MFLSICNAHGCAAGQQEYYADYAKPAKNDRSASHMLTSALSLTASIFLAQCAIDDLRCLAPPIIRMLLQPIYYCRAQLRASRRFWHTQHGRYLRGWGCLQVATLKKSNGIGNAADISLTPCGAGLAGTDLQQLVAVHPAGALGIGWHGAGQQRHGQAENEP